MPKLKAGWWSPAEEQCLLKGHAKHGATGSLSLWADILADSSLSFAIGRTNVDLKDKWRTLRKRVVPSADDPKRLELRIVGGEVRHEKPRDRSKAVALPAAAPPPSALPPDKARAPPPPDHLMRAPPKKRVRALSTPPEAPSECSKCSAASGSESTSSCTSYCPRKLCLVEVCAWCRLCGECRSQPCIRLEQCDTCMRHICEACNEDPSACPSEGHDKARLVRLCQMCEKTCCRDCNQFGHRKGWKSCRLIEERADVPEKGEPEFFTDQCARCQADSFHSSLTSTDPL